ncbi:MAG: TetR/AcrR family transcriptional regulator [Cytophagales bacterium]|nr:TetR/AcrR family transcriptional regulator [Armatimonadota bacterium]
MTDTTGEGIGESDKPPGRKGEQTREHLLRTALRLFVAKGYQATTLRDIATEAGSSLGLTYRYFARKEELVFALYERLAAELEEEVAALPPGPLAARFGRALLADLRRIEPYREAFAALYAAGLAPDSEVAVLGASVGGVRDRVWRTFQTVVTGATDAPRSRQVDEMTTVLYAAHLSVVLFWLQDRSEGQSATRELIAFGTEMLGRFRPVLTLPFASRALTRLARILHPLFGPLPKSP